MHFKATIPVMVNANPPRRPRGTTCVLPYDVFLDFPEVAPQDAPVVMLLKGDYLVEVENWGGDVPIRTWNDRHYLPIMAADRFSAAVMEPFASPEKAGASNRRFINDIFNPIRRRVWDDLGQRENRIAAPWPTLIEHLVREGSSPGVFTKQVEAFSGRGRSIGLEGNALDDARAYAAFFTEAFEGYIVVDGTVHRPIPEPCYCVTLGSGIISVIVPYDLFPSVHDPQHALLLGSDSHLFGADQRDDAIELSRSHGKDRFAVELLETTGSDIAPVHRRALLGIDYEATCLLVTARHLRRLLRVDREPPPAALGTLERLDGEISASAAYRVSPGLESAVRDAFSLDDTCADWFNRHVDAETAQSISFQLDRQDGRKIDVLFRAAPSR